MKNINTIIVPTDFSIPADSAVHYAVELAKAFDASIILYHAFIPFESGFYSIAQSNKENQNTENNLIHRLGIIKDQLLESHKNIPVSIHVDRGPESIRLVEFCTKNKIDLIVMGTKGASGLKEIVIGSFTADTMIKSPCPVLAVPEKYSFKIPEKITFASAYHKSDIQSIKFLLNWNEPFKAKINILHIDDCEHVPASEEEQFTKHKRSIEEQFQEVSLSFQHVEGKEISKAILDISSSDKTDILAFSPIKRKGIWDRLFHKSITKTTAYHINLPLLTIPANEI